MTQGLLLKSAFQIEPLNNGKMSCLALQDIHDKAIHTFFFFKERRIYENALIWCLFRMIGSTYASP